MLLHLIPFPFISQLLTYQLEAYAALIPNV